MSVLPAGIGATSAYRGDERPVLASPSRQGIDPSPPGTITLGALLARTGEAVRVGVPDPVWTLVAVAAVKPSHGGAALELVDPDRPDRAQLRAYLPAAVMQALVRASGHAVEAMHLAGLAVVMRLAVEVHPRWGISARVTALAPGLETSLAARAVEAARSRLRAEGLLDRQHRRPAPRDVTRIAVVHPPEAAGWLDVAVELRRWAAAGIVAFRSIPVPFEGPDAAAGLVAALGRAITPIDGHLPDIILLARGGGARAGLAPLDDEGLARTVANSAIPVVTGLGHAQDRALADDVAWRAADTPSKAVGIVRDLIVLAARRARADHVFTITAVSSRLAAAEVPLAAARHQVEATVSRGIADAEGRVATAWATLGGGARATRERLDRTADGLDDLAVALDRDASGRLGGAEVAVAHLLHEVRARARDAWAAREDGSRVLMGIANRARAELDASTARIDTLRNAAVRAGQTRADAAANDLRHLGEAIRARARGRVARADDGAVLIAAARHAAATARLAADGAVDRLMGDVETIVARRIASADASPTKIAAVFDGADPVRLLDRGFVLVLDGDGRPVVSARAATEAGALTLRFADGVVAVRVIPIRPPNP